MPKTKNILKHPIIASVIAGLIVLLIVEIFTDITLLRTSYIWIWSFLVSSVLVPVWFMMMIAGAFLVSLYCLRKLWAQSRNRYKPFKLELSSTQTEILKILARSEDNRVELDDLVRETGVKKIHVEHARDVLCDHQIITLFGPSKFRAGYKLTKNGRAVVIENKLL